MLYQSTSFRRMVLAAGLLLGGAATQAVQAQPGSGGPGPGTPPVVPTDVPLDGGVTLLLASGIGYGLRQLRRARGAKQVVGI